MPEQLGAVGNEKANATAKVAVINEKNLVLDRAVPYFGMERLISEATRRGWQNKWLFLDREGRKLREMKHDVNELKYSHSKNRRTETVLSCLETGHTYIAHLYLRKSSGM